MELWGLTDCGKVRKHNQDVFRIQQSDEHDIAILVVCDGMGGTNAGNIASELATSTFLDFIKRNIDEAKDLDDYAELISDASVHANTIVFNKSLYNEALEGMGTTLVAAIVINNDAVISNIGDSRLYHVTGEKIKQITSDHSVVEEMVERGEITREEARIHPRRNYITRAIGASAYEPPDLYFLSLKENDYILLCTDGLTNMVSDEEILTQFQKGCSIQESCEALLETALKRGAPDNVTVVLLKK
ncbi:MAG: Stp1/IreP family PP2C-type Ser/Thr phosphatase [Oscillospiraceae bacterium]|jgi:protein phosphatase|nr:Stp1/IreP family PP2C-type Ser/Thr phosphatase [Oscillospiraceae bacterium]